MSSTPTTAVYEIQALTPDRKPQTAPCTIEAPSPGIAVEFFLAIHGLLGYDIITLKETDEMPEESIEDVQKLLPNCYDPDFIKQHDEWHHWEKPS